MWWIQNACNARILILFGFGRACQMVNRIFDESNVESPQYTYIQMKEEKSTNSDQKQQDKRKTKQPQNYLLHMVGMN